MSYQIARREAALSMSFYDEKRERTRLREWTATHSRDTRVCCRDVYEEWLPITEYTQTHLERELNNDLHCTRLVPTRRELTAAHRLERGRNNGSRCFHLPLPI